VRVDLEVRLSPSRPLVWRLGGGFETDQSRSDVHLLASVEHRNLNFGPLGRMWRLRIDERPLFFFQSLFANTSNIANSSVFPFGNVLAVELRRPEIWRGGTLIFSTQFDLGPDPINPNVAFRNSLRLAAGAQHRFSREVTGAAYVRGTIVDYSLSPDTSILSSDRLYQEQYITQAYAYLEQQITWDRRDAPLQPRQGTYLSASAQEAVAPLFGPDYSFVRGWLDFRGYLSLGGNVVLAGRLGGGVVLGFSEGNANAPGWPVPQELRFFSGGANSNRGYPFNRVGLLGSVPELRCEPPPPAGQRCTLTPGAMPTQQPRPIYDQTVEGTRPDPFRLTAIGGLMAWEASVELRWYFGSFGLSAFFDASDVRGGGTNPVTGALNGLNLGFDAHPSAGIGVRYLSPIGIVRLDLGVRLDDLACTRFNVEALEQNRPPNPPAPTFYTFTRPQCDLFGLALPVALNFAIGETY
jgi:hypothetical protein